MEITTLKINFDKSEFYIPITFIAEIVHYRFGIFFLFTTIMKTGG